MVVRTDLCITASLIHPPPPPPPCLVLFSTTFLFKALQRKMEVQSGVQQPETRPLGSPRSGANQQNETDDRPTDASGRHSADNHSKDAQPASQKDDKKVSRRLPLLHICSCCAVCLGVSVHVCDEWWDPACLLSYSVWYVLYFHTDRLPRSLCYLMEY